MRKKAFLSSKSVGCPIPKTHSLLSQLLQNAEETDEAFNHILNLYEEVEKQLSNQQRQLLEYQAEGLAIEEISCLLKSSQENLRREWFQLSLRLHHGMLNTIDGVSGRARDILDQSLSESSSFVEFMETATNPIIFFELLNAVHNWKARSTEKIKRTDI